ncbi:MAG: hypothetical protein KGO82_16645 [Bacteroidota bacterium]|nr:hypothetical protein [Bacteroidota bacterium]
MSYTTVAHCGNEHASWLKSIAFYEEEFDRMKQQLLELASKNTGHELMAQVEHFQNQFILQRNNTDELKHAIREHDMLVGAEASAHAGKIELATATNHNKVREEFLGIEKVVNDLRHEFNAFLSKWL